MAMIYFLKKRHIQGKGRHVALLFFYIESKAEHCISVSKINILNLSDQKCPDVAASFHTDRASECSHNEGALYFDTVLTIVT